MAAAPTITKGKRTAPVVEMSTSARRPRTVGRRLQWFVLPAVVFYGFVVLVPTIQGGYVSLTDWNAIAGTRKFVGLGNYSKIADSASSDVAVRTLVIQNLLGLLLELTLHGRAAPRPD